MKKTTTRIISFLVALAIFTAAILCAIFLPRETEPVESQGSCTVVIQGKQTIVYKVSLSEVEITEGLFSVLRHLKEKEGLTYDIVESTYGAYINSIGTAVPDLAKNEYVAIYTSVEADADVSAWATTTVWEGKTLTSSGFGASQMHIEDGAVILLTLGSY